MKWRKFSFLFRHARLYAHAVAKYTYKGIYLNLLMQQKFFLNIF